MNKLNATDLIEQQVVDLRSQQDFQKAHVPKSLNLNPKNFKKYALDFLSLEQPIVFVADEETETDLQELEALAKEFGFTQIDGYILIQDISNEKLDSIPTISAENFLNKEDSYILLDVRHPDEITRPAPKKHLVNILLDELTEAYDSLDPNKEVYTLCGSGNRGTSAASYLSSKGFKTTVIEGGMKAIQEVSNK